MKVVLIIHQHSCTFTFRMWLDYTRYFSFIGRFGASSFFHICVFFTEDCMRKSHT